MATAGRAVVTSGGTVAMGLLALVLLPVPFLRSIGFAGLLIPLAATLATLTLLPVLLATIGPRLDRPASRRARRDPARRGARPAGAGPAGRPGWSATAGWPPWPRWPCSSRSRVAALGLRLGEPPADVLAQSGAGPRGARPRWRRAGVGSGVLTPIEVLVPAGTDRRRTRRRLDGVAGVRLAVAPTGPAWQRDGTALVSVLPVAETSADDGEATARAGPRPGRGRAARRRGSGAAAPWPSTPPTAHLRRFPLMLAAVAVVTFVLLARAFRSLLLPLKAIVLNLLSIGAAYGVLVLVWQEGHGSEADLRHPGHRRDRLWVPLMAFAFLYGLSMDYEVFLLARMREEYDATGSTDEAAVVQGLGRAGRLVTSAALILFLAFAAMAAIPELDIKIMATGLAPASCSTPPRARAAGPGPGRPARALELVAARLGGPASCGSRRRCPPPSPPGAAARGAGGRPMPELSCPWCRPAGCGTVSSRSCGARAGRPLDDRFQGVSGRRRSGIAVGWPVLWLCQIAAVRARRRCRTRTATPVVVRPPWRSRSSWPLKVSLTDSMICRSGRNRCAAGPWRFALRAGRSSRDPAGRPGRFELGGRGSPCRRCRV